MIIKSTEAKVTFNAMVEKQISASLLQIARGIAWVWGNGELWWVGTANGQVEAVLKQTLYHVENAPEGSKVMETIQILVSGVNKWQQTHPT